MHFMTPRPGPSPVLASFPSPARLYPPLLSHCLPHTRLMGGLEEQTGARAKSGRSTWKGSRWVFFLCLGWGCAGYQACCD